MRFIGVDPSTTKIGLACVEAHVSPKFVCVSHELLDVGNKGHAKDRLPDIYDGLCRFFDTHKDVTQVGMESGFMRNQKSTEALSMVRGLVYLITGQCGMHVELMAPTSLKKQITGSGKSDKSVVIKTIEDYYGLSGLDDNEADALGAASIVARKWKPR